MSGLPAELAPGEPFPDLELPDHHGAPRRLSALVAGDATFLHTFRGWWCPKERAFFRRLVALQDELEVSYARIVSLSIDAPETLAAFRSGLDARWTFLSDHERTALPGLGLRESTDTVHDPYLPVGFLLTPDLTIHRVWDGYWFWGRPTLEELRQGFREVTRATRDDWDAPAA